MNDLATVISAVGTVVTTGIALFLVRQGQTDRRDVRTAAEREQAEKFTSWADWHRPDDATRAPGCPRSSL